MAENGAPDDKSARRRRLSIISLPDENATGRGANEKDTQGQAGAGGPPGGDRRRRLSIVGLYTGEVIQAEEAVDLTDNGAGEDPDSHESTNVVRRFGYTSTAGYEPSGHKKTNQDAFCVFEDFAGVRNQYLFGVFDGHGRAGHKASNFVASEIGGSFAAKLKSSANISTAFMNNFVEMDRDMSKRDFDCKMSGTTAVVVFIRGDQLYTANVGDSRAIMATRTEHGLQPVELSFDQKPELPAEQTRIEGYSGIVEPILDPYEGPVGPCRVWVKRQAIPGLAMSRSLGDKLAGTVGVCPNPVVNAFKVEQSCDEFMIVASDGIWEFIDNEEAIAIVASFEDPQEACDFLCAEALKRWKTEEHVVDDITAIVVQIKKLD